MDISVVTWNVNSIRARLQHVLRYLRDTAPDILLLQELKLETQAFPYEEIETLGYQCAVHGQKTYNGVAILSKYPLDDITTSLPVLDEADAEDTQARYIEALVTIDTHILRVASIYVPNGMDRQSSKFAYKLRFMSRLHHHASLLLSYEEALVLGADYNIAYLPHDVYDANTLDGSICYNHEERSAMQALLNTGLYDAYRVLHPDTRAYTWWDYRGGKFQDDAGLRIDHLLLSPEATDMLQSCEVDREERSRDKPSDHAPLRCYLTL